MTLPNRPLAFTLILSLLPVTVFGFGTVNTLGQNAEHEKITRAALAPLGFEPETLAEIAGKTGTFGAVGAPDNPARGLMSHLPAPCDDGDYLDVASYPHAATAAREALTACRGWILDAMEQALAAAGRLLGPDGAVDDSQVPNVLPCVYNGRPGRAKCEVMEALGLALHAAQDFYAHSNWTDEPVPGAPSIQTPPGLAMTRPAEFIAPGGSAAVPTGLLSGCYDGFPEALFCDGRVRHDVLNKDTGPIDLATGTIGEGTTARAKGNDNFARAVRAAIADTEAKWAWFEAAAVTRYGPERGDRIICAIKTDNPALTCP